MSIRKTHDGEQETVKGVSNKINEIQQKNIHQGYHAGTGENPEQVGKRRQTPGQMDIIDKDKVTLSNTKASL